MGSILRHDTSRTSDRARGKRNSVVFSDHVQVAGEPGYKIVSLNNGESNPSQSISTSDSRDLDPSNKDLDPSNKHLDPSNNDLNPANKDLDPSNKDFDPSNKYLDPSNTEFDPTNKDSSSTQNNSPSKSSPLNQPSSSPSKLNPPTSNKIESSPKSKPSKSNPSSSSKRESSPKLNPPTTNKRESSPKSNPPTTKKRESSPKSNSPTPSKRVSDSLPSSPSRHQNFHLPKTSPTKGSSMTTHAPIEFHHDGFSPSHSAFSTGEGALSTSQVKLPEIHTPLPSPARRRGGSKKKQQQQIRKERDAATKIVFLGDEAKSVEEKYSKRPSNKGTRTGGKQRSKRDGRTKKEGRDAKGVRGEQGKNDDKRENQDRTSGSQNSPPMPTINIIDVDEDKIYDGSDMEEAAMRDYWKAAEEQEDLYFQQFREEQQEGKTENDYKATLSADEAYASGKSSPNRKMAWSEEEEEDDNVDDWRERKRREEEAYKEKEREHELEMEKWREKELQRMKEEDEQREKKRKKKKKNRVTWSDTEEEKGEYVVSGPQGADLYSTRQVALPPLSHTPNSENTQGGSKKRRSRAKSVLYPYIHGQTHPGGTTATSQPPSRTSSAGLTSTKSKDDSRIQYEYELNVDEAEEARPSRMTQDRWRARKVRFYRNGDRYYPGYEFVFKPGRDVVNMEALCDKISDRIGLINGARYVFGLDGRRRYRLEELEDGESYVASSDRKFVTLPYGLLALKPGKWGENIVEPEGVTNLAYGRHRGDWNQNTGGDPSRAGSPVVREVSKKASADSNKSSGSSNSKPGSREGRTIKIINNIDHSQERIVLVNMKTISLWEDVVKDLGRMFKLTGQLHLFTTWGQEVKSFSQFKNDFANVDTFYVSVTDSGVPARTPYPPSSPPSTPGRGGSPGGGRRRSLSEEDDKRAPRADRKTSKSSKRQPLRRYTSEPALKEMAEESEGGEEISEGRVAIVMVKGQKRVLYAPKNPVTYRTSPPRSRLTLDWVYGYRGSDTRRNLWVLPSGELLYYVSAVVVILDRNDEIQRHYTEHTEDIQCMALHPTRDLVASGQRASRGRRSTAHVRVWHARTLTTLHVLGRKELGAGILAVAFSIRNHGEFLLAVDADKEHLLSVWTWDNEKVFGKVATHQDHVWGAAFHPLDNNLIITYGRGLLSLWARRKDGIFTRSDLVTEGSGRTVTALEFTQDGDLITGDQDGVLTIWSIDAEGDYYVKKEFQAHTSAVNSLQMLSEGTVLSGGDKDRKIIAWDCEEDFDKITETKLPEQAGGVRTLYPQRPGHNDGNIYVGTTRNMILEGSLQRRFNQVVFGHSKQLWGLAVNHLDGSLATAGYDKHIVKWRDTHLEWRIQAQSECVSVAVHPQGTRIAAGTIDGHLVVLNGHTGQRVTTLRVCGSPLSCLAYNPGGELLAVGSQNGSVYLYRSTKDGFVYTKCGKMAGTQPLSAIDWSTSGRYIQTLTADYDIVYWSMTELTKVKNNQEVRNEAWASQTCPLGFTVHGVWGGGKDAPVQVTVDRGPRGDILAAGDTDGYIRLFRYPVLNAYAGYHEYKVYTSYVSSLRFSHTDNFLYSIGGTDAALMRWRVT